MRTDWWKRLAMALSLITATTFVGGSFARAEDKPGKGTGIVDDKPGAVIGQPTDILIAEPSLLQGAKLQVAGRYWIGVMCEPAGETLHAQLPDLPKDQGLVVQKVMPDSPAMKAGIQANDILLSANDKPLAQVPDLSGAIEAGKGAELTIKLLRGGKTIGIAVKPEEQKIAGEPLNGSLVRDDEALRVWINRLQSEAGGANPLDQRTIRISPATAIPWEFGPKHELPDDMSVDIFRDGKKPAKITVKKGDQKWEITEEQLGKLPEDVRHAVEPLVGGGPVRIDLNVAGDLDGAFHRQSPFAFRQDSSGNVRFAAKPDAIEDRLEKNLNEMSQRLEEMRGTLRELRAQRPHHDGSNAEKEGDKPGK